MNEGSFGRTQRKAGRYNGLTVCSMCLCRQSIYHQTLIVFGNLSQMMMVNYVSSPNPSLTDAHAMTITALVIQFRRTTKLIKPVEDFDEANLALAAGGAVFSFNSALSREFANTGALQNITIACLFI